MTASEAVPPVEAVPIRSFVSLETTSVAPVMLLPVWIRSKPLGVVEAKQDEYIKTKNNHRNFLISSPSL
jgi:hypothetical protein